MVRKDHVLLCSRMQSQQKEMLKTGIRPWSQRPEFDAGFLGGDLFNFSKLYLLT